MASLTASVARRYVKTIGLVIVIAAVFAISGPAAQTQPDSSRSSLIGAEIPLAQQADCLAFGDARTVRAFDGGPLRAIGTEAGRSIRHPRPVDALAGPEPAARSYLSLCGSLFGLPERGELRLKRQEAVTRLADDGHLSRRSVVRFQQAQNGVPVIGGELIVHLDDAQNILFVGGKAMSKPLADVVPTVVAAAAAKTALATVAKAHATAADALVASTPELSIYEPRLIGPGSNPSVLVWRVEVTPRTPEAIRELVLVDAKRGSVALHFNQAETILNRATYNSGHTTSTGSLVCDESNPTCSGGDVDAVLAHRYAADTYAFYRNILGRDSINNAGMTIISSEHYGPVGYPNAFWNGTQMFYGDGFSVGDDVVGHELTHGVTQYTSDLFYFYQAGAINESLSDVFGELIDQTNLHGNDDSSLRWLIGEDLPGGAIRSMSNPPAFGDPDRMRSVNYYLGADDNGGVHFNSGVNNKAASLIVDGGTFNNRSVLAIGFAKAAYIYYEAQTHLLTSGSDYADLHEALFQACANLVGIAGVSTLDCQQVRNATLAVEMDQQPVPAFNPEAPVCAAGQTPANLFFDNLEAGPGNFQMASTASVRWQYDSPYGPFAHSGHHFLYADDFPDTVTDATVTMVPGVTLPANAFLRFAHAYGFEGPAYDGGVVEYTTNGGATWNDAGGLFDSNGYTGTVAVGFSNPLAGRSAFVGDSHGYRSARLNLGSLAGQNVRFRWRMGLDVSDYYWGWWLDDVQVYTCVTPAVTAESVAPASGTGLTQTFALQYGDNLGASDMASAWVWFSPSLTAPSTNSCLAYYARPTNTLNLLNNAGTAYTSGTVGSAGTLQNSQCAIPLSSATTVSSGNTLTVNVPVTFTPSFAGAKTVFMYGASASGINSGWQSRGTWTVPVPPAPVLTSDLATPSAGSGTTQAFALQYGDTAGATDLSTSWVWFSPSLSAPSANSCLVHYARGTNTVNLLNNAGTAYTSGIAGGGGTLQNSQCSIALGGVTTIASGTSLTVNLPVTFTSGFAGVKTIFMYAANAGGTNSGWQNRGTWTVPAPFVPVVTADLATPSSGAGGTQSFALQYGDTAGATDLATAWLWFSPALTAPSANSCLAYYVRATNTLNLLNNAGTTYASAVLGSSGTLQNNQCSMAVSGATAVVSGNTLTLNLPVTFAASFAGSKSLFMYAANAGGVNSGWQARGTWTVPAPAAPAVTADLVMPSSGTGTTQAFALQYADTAGATDLATAWAWFSSSFTAPSANSCLVYYARATNTLNLLNNAGTAYTSGIAGTGGTLQNSQCSIALNAITTSLSGNVLTINVPVTFASAFAGTKTVFMYAANGSGTTSGWQTRGTWTVPAPAAAVVTADLVSPSTGTGGTPTFALQYGDTAGATDLSTAWVWFSPSFTAPSSSSCLVYYLRAANALYLLNDAGTAYTAGVVGSAGTLQNSQCSIGLSGVTTIISGNTLTVNLPVNFSPAFSGPKSVFMYAANAGGVTSGWQTRGTWTVP